MDDSQDVELLMGYRNFTHSVLRFKRPLVTCDKEHDVPITVSFSYKNMNQIYQIILVLYNNYSC